MPSLENEATNCGDSRSDASVSNHTPTSGCGAPDGVATSVVSVTASTYVAGASVPSSVVAAAAVVAGTSLADGASVVPGAPVSAGPSVVAAGSVLGTVSSRSAAPPTDAAATIPPIRTVADDSEIMNRRMLQSPSLCRIFRRANDE